MIWKAKIPQRIEVFLWLVLKNRILSKVNLKIRNWRGILAVPGVAVQNQQIISFLSVRWLFSLGA
jgi:hypothetical protein